MTITNLKGRGWLLWGGGDYNIVISPLGLWTPDALEDLKQRIILVMYLENHDNIHFRLKWTIYEFILDYSSHFLLGTRNIARNNNLYAYVN